MSYILARIFQLQFEVKCTMYTYLVIRVPVYVQKADSTRSTHAGQSLIHGLKIDSDE